MADIGSPGLDAPWQFCGRCCSRGAWWALLALSPCVLSQPHAPVLKFAYTPLTTLAPEGQQLSPLTGVLSSAQKTKHSGPWASMAPSVVPALSPLVPCIGAAFQLDLTSLYEDAGRS